MNINKIEELVNIEKIKYTEENNSVDSLLDLFNPSVHTKYANFFVFIINVFLVCFSGYCLTKATFKLSQYFANTIGILPATLCLIFGLAFALIFSLCASFGFYIFSNGILLKEKLTNAKSSPEEYNEIADYIITPIFNKKYISEDILNHLKIDLSTEDYQSIRIANKQGITYEALYSFLEVEKEKENIREEQRNVICKDNKILEGSETVD